MACIARKLPSRHRPRSRVIPAGRNRALLPTSAIRPRANRARRIGVQFPAADFPHATGRRQPGLLLRQTAFGNLALGDVDEQRIKSHDLLALSVRQVIGLPMPNDAVGAGFALIEQLALAVERGSDSRAPARLEALVAAAPGAKYLFEGHSNELLGSEPDSVEV